MPVNVSEAERVIAHFRQHSGFIRRIYIPVVVVDQNVGPRTIRRLKVYVTSPIRRENLG